MLLRELKKRLENLPAECGCWDDAEVTYGRYQGFYNTNREECLIISLGNQDHFIDIPKYKGLPT